MMDPADSSPQPPDDTWLPPETFDEYRLVRPLGEGAMGRVWLAEDTLLGRPVAVKFIAAARPSPEARERFITEARAVARLQHPNVVSLFRAGTVEGRPYLVSEYLRGEPLHTLPRPLPSERVLELAIDLARGLAAAHRRGVLHRDLKPANALLTEDGTVKLLDFGLAKLLDGGGVARPVMGTVREPSGLSGRDVALAEPAAEVADAVPVRPVPLPSVGTETLPSEARPRVATGPDSTASVADGARTRQGAILGTPLYMAPESWRGEPATPRTDVYGLGVILYELASGAVPFADAALAELPVRLQREDAPPLAAHAPGVDPRLAEVVDRCLRRDASRRYPNGDALREALEALAWRPGPEVLPAGNPYRGLLPFEAEHRGLFFGRGPEVRAVLDRLRSESFVLVAAASGVGKSSLCRAGVLPALAAGALGTMPTMVTLSPGRTPLAALVAALAPVLGLPEAELETGLREAPDGVARTLRARTRSSGVLVCVDPMEELFTLAPMEEAHAMARALAALCLDAPGVRLLATVRSDFLGQALTLPGLGEAAGRAIFPLPPLSAVGVREAIEGPARAHAHAFESEALVEALTTPALHGEGTLPLLQFTLAQLWERRDTGRRLLTASALDDMGGVEGALARHADAVLASLTPAQRVAARRVLLSLITPDGTRAPRTADALGASEPATRAALEALVRGRLVTALDAEAGGAYTLAHEALLRGWDTLRAWREGDAEVRLAVARLERAATEWVRLGQPTEALWGAKALAEAEDLPRERLGTREATFLEASLAARRQRLRTRWALGAGAVTLLLVALLPWGKARYDQAHSLAVLHGVAEKTVAESAARRTEALAARQAAFARFDAFDEQGGETLWATALTKVADADAAGAQAQRALERVREVAPEDAAAREQLAALTVERLRFVLATHRPSEAAPLRALLAEVDPEGHHRARQEAPARVDITSTPTGARVRVVRYVDVGGRKEARDEGELGRTPLKDAKLAPGSVVLVLEAEGHAPVRLPLLLEAESAEQVTLTLPLTKTVPEGFVYIPPGKFLSGHAGDEGLRRYFLHAWPLRPVRTDAYLIARHETTFGEWTAFLDTLPAEEATRRAPRLQQLLNGVALERGPRGHWRLTLSPSTARYVASEGEPVRYSARTTRAEQDWRRFPVSGVSLEDVRAYAAWLDATGRVPGARPCTDFEWERAARGADARIYPHGDVLAPDDINHDVTYGRQPGGFGPDMVGSHPASDSPFGVQDLSGNVWEWTVSDGPAPEPVNRGGCWYFGTLSAMVPNREFSEASHRDPLLGVRLCAPAR
ncbi:bifunctional serine/threonine-protein kinase/formylglycine-generating enzyme family protein [Pyxidicoccus caerfyrddinensis]|uniref:bifunctional serine/threonine-protein kinase/formylglycine-generating enzyme family protein n=1 Tax=Pyxidicoccus caerfyrddinensis TaxID=2709663 RepID=UPI0013DBACF5|nr:bifunctional serine/threonine-protein kinase/formylglycine-generating enzyme family protein [Pyxidicoccus caerfyrddinensis]